MPTQPLSHPQNAAFNMYCTHAFPKKRKTLETSSPLAPSSSPRRQRRLVPRRVRAVEEAWAVADAVPEATVELRKAEHVRLVERQRGADEVLCDPARLHALGQASEAAPHAPRDQHLRGRVPPRPSRRWRMRVLYVRAHAHVQRLRGRHAVLGRDLGDELVLQQRGAAVPRLEGV
eukprot:scaffold83043_cov57-Phaeocystis_antarctica.AAC.2